MEQPQVPPTASKMWAREVKSTDWPMQNYNLFVQDASDFELERPRLELLEMITEPGQEEIKSQTLTAGQVQVVRNLMTEWLKLHGLE